MPSTVIHRFDYSPEGGQLTIEFVSGRRYVYSGVPQDEVEALRGASSKGSYFNRKIRERYAFREPV